MKEPRSAEKLGISYGDEDELGWLGHINPDDIHDFVVEELDDE